MAAGITARHAKACRAGQGGRCNCQPTYQAQVYDGRTGRRLSKTFPTTPPPAHRATTPSWRSNGAI